MMWVFVKNKKTYKRLWIILNREYLSLILDDLSKIAVFLSTMI